MLSKLVSLLGILIFLLVAWSLSRNKLKFPLKTVVWGLGLQLAFALLVLKTSIGKSLFQFANNAVGKIEVFAREGSMMVFGPLADVELLSKAFGPENTFVFAITIPATIILVSALSSLLYHWNILPKVVHGMALVMQRTMGTSGSESLAAASNIFVGQTEAPLVIKPYIQEMTRSELMALMTGGMATIAGGVLVAYVSFGAEAGHLMTASLMSAPAALLVAKIMEPETEESKTSRALTMDLPSNSTNSIDALCRGSAEGLKLSLNVMAMLITFTAVVAMANYLVGILGRPFELDLNIQKLVGWINAPVAWLIGIPWKDCVLVGQSLGERIVLNEFFGYLTITGNRDQLDPRSFTLATYALCGFANFASIAIQIGGIGSLAPERRSDLARLGFRSMLGGLLACYITASLVGVLE